MNIKNNVRAIIALVSLAALPVIAQETKVKEAAVKTKDGVVKGAEVVGSKTKDGVSKTGEVMTDTWITARVSGRFVDEPLLKDSNINVDSKAHIVTLKGTVLTRAGRTRARRA